MLSKAIIYKQSPISDPEVRGYILGRWPTLTSITIKEVKNNKTIITPDAQFATFIFTATNLISSQVIIRGQIITIQDKPKESHLKVLQAYEAKIPSNEKYCSSFDYMEPDQIMSDDWYKDWGMFMINPYNNTLPAPQWNQQLICTFEGNRKLTIIENEISYDSNSPSNDEKEDYYLRGIMTSKWGMKVLNIGNDLNGKNYSPISLYYKSEHWDNAVLVYLFYSGILEGKSKLPDNIINLLKNPMYEQWFTSYLTGEGFGTWVQLHNTTLRNSVIEKLRNRVNVKTVYSEYYHNIKPLILLEPKYIDFVSKLDNILKRIRNDKELQILGQGSVINTLKVGFLGF